MRESIREQWRDFKDSVEKPRCAWYFLALLVLDVALDLVDFMQ